MSFFTDDRVALLEFQEGEMRGKRKAEYLWHYNWGDSLPETFGWHGLLWYNRKNDKASKLIDGFCDIIDKTYPKRDATFEVVKRFADFFVSNLSDSMKKVIIPFKPEQFYKNGLSDAKKVEKYIIEQRKGGGV